MAKPVLLFDGVCNLCNGTVQFLLRIDQSECLTFASLQSEAGQAMLQSAQYAGPPLDSVVLFHQGRIWTHSDAALEVCRLLGGPWTLLYAFKIIPRPLRNALYNWIARNRYRWFGKQEACWMPTPELRRRFL